MLKRTKKNWRKIHYYAKKRANNARKTRKPMKRSELQKIYDELYKKDKKNLLLLDNKSVELFKLCLRKYYRSPKSCNFYIKYKL
jgi:hypothetical protein